MAAAALGASGPRGLASWCFREGQGKTMGDGTRRGKDCSSGGNSQFAWVNYRNREWGKWSFKQQRDIGQP